MNCDHDGDAEQQEDARRAPAPTKVAEPEQLAIAQPPAKAAPNTSAPIRIAALTTVSTLIQMMRRPCGGRWVAVTCCSSVAGAMSPKHAARSSLDLGHARPHLGPRPYGPARRAHATMTQNHGICRGRATIPCFSRGPGRFGCRRSPRSRPEHFLPGLRAGAWPSTRPRSTRSRRDRASRRSSTTPSRRWSAAAGCSTGCPTCSTRWPARIPTTRSRRSSARSRRASPAHRNGIYLNEALFRRVDDVFTPPRARSA